MYTQDSNKIKIFLNCNRLKKFVKVTKWINFYRRFAYKTARFSLLALLLLGNLKRPFKEGCSAKELRRMSLNCGTVHYHSSNLVLPLDITLYDPEF